MPNFWKRIKSWIRYKLTRKMTIWAQDEDGSWVNIDDDITNTKFKNFIFTRGGLDVEG